MYAWKRLDDGHVSQDVTAESAEDLFENAGFGAVDVDKPIKGFLAVKVTGRPGAWVEDLPAGPDGAGMPAPRA